MVNHVYTYIPEPSTLLKYNDKGVIIGIVGTDGIVQLDDNITKIVSMGRTILIVSKNRIKELLL